MDAGLTMNAAVVVVCLLVGALALRNRAHPRHAEVLALVTCALVVGAWPLTVALQRRVTAGPGSADLSQAWSWLLLAMTAVASSTAVLLVVRSARRSMADRAQPPAVLDSLVVAKMAIELDQPAAAADALQAAITTITTISAERTPAGPVDHAVRLDERSGS